MILLRSIVISSGSGWLLGTAMLNCFRAFGDAPPRSQALCVIDVIVAAILVVGIPIDRSLAKREGFDFLRKGMDAFYGRR